ncbi:MAG: hypothetical protein PWQ96_2506 [Clostridia bacterium]|jgi:hypothetical protein|nr:hypothetical protein [Clostridia bacterium]
MYERGDIQYDTKRNDSFKSHKPNHRLEGKTVNPTQFGKAMQELGINIIKARSPQAKGRIEKLWQTLQSRLKAELEIYGIDSIEFANAFLPKFIESYNKRFGVQPETLSQHSDLLTLVSTSIISFASKNDALSLKALPSHTKKNIISWSRTVKWTVE